MLPPMPLASVKFQTSENRPRDLYRHHSQSHKHDHRIWNIYLTESPANPQHDHRKIPQNTPPFTSQPYKSDPSPRASPQNHRMASSSRSLFVLGVITLLAMLAGEANGSVGGFVQVRGTEFVLNGSPFLFNGFNSYWMMNVAVDPSQRCKVTEVFREAAAAGLSVCRTWGFSDGGAQALQLSPGVFDEQVFQALDFVISEASKYGIRMILSLSNNYKDFGGRPQYIQWARNAGAAINGDDDFYTNPVVKGYYKNYVKRVLSRCNSITKIAYRDDPTIMAWELINEPRCQVDYSGRTVNAWVQEMASYVKTLDCKHLLEIGMEGFYGDSMPEKKQYNPGYQVGTDFISSNLVPEIDFSTIHAYTDQWLPGQSDGAQSAFMQRWLWSHWSDARTIIKKPLVFAEFGKSNKDPGYTIGGRNWFLGNVYRNIYSFARNGGTIGGGLVWQLMATGMENYYDGYEIVLSQDPSMTSLITRQSHAMSALERTKSLAMEVNWETEYGHTTTRGYNRSGRRVKPDNEGNGIQTHQP